MSRRFLFFIVAAVVLVGCQKKAERGTVTSVPAPAAALQPVRQVSTVSDQIALSRENAITRAVERVSPAVTGINVTSLRQVYGRSPFWSDPFFRYFFDELPYAVPVKSLGSGFLVSADGKILTNQHVVEGANEIIVTMVDGSHHNAKLIGQDRVSDIALLQIKGSGFPFVEFGDSDGVIIGEWAIAFGNPFGLFDLNAKPTVTVGVISAKGQNFGRQENRRIYQNMLQTDASINQGNSGGPLANALGQVVGMNTFIFTGGNSGGSIGIGFALPIKRVKKILREIEQYGQINRRYWTGLEVQDLTPFLARYLQLSSSRGIIVTGVDDASPAERARIRVGDVILAVNGEPIRNTDDLVTVIETADLRAGDSLTLRVNRGGRELDVQIKLGSLPN